MSERILNALMQLFAIIAKIDVQHENGEDHLHTKGHQVIRSFLHGELSPDKVEKYVQLFDKYFHQLRSSNKKKASKRHSVNSVKVLRICSEINEELSKRQKFIVLVRILELILEDEQASTLETEFVKTVAETFNIERKEYQLILRLLVNDYDLESPPNHMIVLSNKPVEGNAQTLHVANLRQPIVVILIRSLHLIFFKHLGKEDLFMNGQLLRSNKIYLFSQGGILKTTRCDAIYQSDLLNRFLRKHRAERFSFRAEDITYQFSDSKNGLHPFNFEMPSGNLIGIMGGSGTGKTTLINILNGSMRPSTGRVLLNQTDIYADPKSIEGLIGYISQDDLLIEELTVFDNLYFSAKLSFKHLSEKELTRKVVRVLHALGLYDTRNLKVGNPLEKIISGGQRKRLNIGLELIREPAILFVDEPTSGLSSRDSMNIMNLLKEQAFRGKLVFVVIHQPSSEIYKLFNHLILMDKGGFPIYQGFPIDALSYFKRELAFANADENECVTCGNINPEQLFDMIESNVVDELGHNTTERRISPKEWYDRYSSKQLPLGEIKNTQAVTAHTNKPSRFEQFRVFFVRDLLSKIGNTQYVLITLLEAPLLAAILAFCMKYFGHSNVTSGYSFYKNDNIPYFIFVSVLVSLFFGMTVAAEEINKDKKILKREQFLNLSRSSYLFSKLSLLILISIAQCMLFVIVGNNILEIKGMYWEYWFILFSTSVWANIMGLNISSAFNLAKVIYIIVPILIIPQLLFSGALVKFNRLHPVISHPTEVPWIGNLMISRWSYEALMVEQAVDNNYEQLVYPYRQAMSEAQWKRDFWIPEIEQLARFPKNAAIIQAEIAQEAALWGNLECQECFDDGIVMQTPLSQFLGTLKLQYTENYNRANDQLEALKKRIGQSHFKQLREQFGNENLNNIVRNHYELERIVLEKKSNRLLQVSDPIFQFKPKQRFLDYALFAPNKNVGGKMMSTFWANTLVIWLFSAFLFVALYFDWLRKLVEMSRNVRRKK